MSQLQITSVNWSHSSAERSYVIIVPRTELCGSTFCSDCSQALALPCTNLFQQQGEKKNLCKKSNICMLFKNSDIVYFWPSFEHLTGKEHPCSFCESFAFQPVSFLEDPKLFFFFPTFILVNNLDHDFRNNGCCRYSKLIQITEIKRISHFIFLSLQLFPSGSCTVIHFHPLCVWVCVWVCLCLLDKEYQNLNLD